MTTSTLLKEPWASVQLEQKVLAFVTSWIRKHRNPALRAKISSEGIANQALFDLKKKLPEFENRQQFWRWLASTAFHIMNNQIRWEEAAKRDWRRERPDQKRAPEEVPLDQLPDQSSELDKIYLEETEDFHNVLDSVHRKAQRILDLSLQGYTASEVAEQIDLSTRSVQDIKRRMQAAWQQAMEQ